LSKQFEPQFEPNDLLQMHNRNFIINMVIKGEKSPAFSASTLTLPPPTTDNSQQIIENTRRDYSRARADVEQEIDAAIQPPQHLQSKKPPQSATQAKQWPINAHTQTATPNRIVFKTDNDQPAQPSRPSSNDPSQTRAPQSTTKPSTTPPAQQGSVTEGTVPEKKKRTRSRKRKPAASTSTQEHGERTSNVPETARQPRQQAASEQGSRQSQQPEKGKDSPPRNRNTPTPKPPETPRDETVLRIR
jgi:hypothetical protein